MKTRREWYNLFLEYRKAYGKKDYAIGSLNVFLNWCDKVSNDSPYFTEAIVNEWISKRETEKNSSHEARVNIVNQFLTFINLRSLDEHYNLATFGTLEKPDEPEFFTEEELKLFFQALDELTERTERCNSNYARFCSTVNGIVYPAFFRTLYSTGIRPYEARMLRCRDVNFAEGILFLHEAKGYNERIVVIEQSVIKMLRKYDEVIRRIMPDRTQFFPSSKNGIIVKRKLLKAFRRCWDKYNKPHGEKRVTMYAFRHYFIIKNVLRWDSRDPDIEMKMLVLSKYVGHSTIDKTVKYMHYIPRYSEIIEEISSERIKNILNALESDEEE